MPTYQVSSRPRYAIFRDNELGTIAPGGDCIQFTANGTLKLGDVVYLSSSTTVAISVTGSNHDKVIGVVVGGQALGSSAVNDDAALVGTTAATNGQTVIVLVRGVAYVVLAGTIAAGVSIVADTTTAGRVKAATALTGSGANPTQANPTQAASTIDAGATAVTSSAANGAIITNGAITAGAITQGAVSLAGEGTGRIIGRLLQNGAVTNKKLAWINPQ